MRPEVIWNSPVHLMVLIVAMVLLGGLRFVRKD